MDDAWIGLGPAGGVVCCFGESRTMDSWTMLEAGEDGEGFAGDSGAKLKVSGIERRNEAIRVIKVSATTTLMSVRRE